ncbi:hypothetical protein D3C86_1828270 [compost metagenome]
MLVLHDAQVADFAGLDDRRLRAADGLAAAVTGTVLGHPHGNFPGGNRDAHRLARRNLRYQLVLHVQFDVAGVRRMLVAADQQFAEGFRRRLQRGRKDRFAGGEHGGGRQHEGGKDGYERIHPGSSPASNG